MKERDFIYIEFTGRAKDTDDIFDTTDAEMAKLAGIHSEKVNYTSIPIIVGAHQVIPGLEEALMEMKVGEKRKVEIKSDKAFGEKNSEMVRLLPMSIFKESNMIPEIGRTVTMSGINGKIIIIDGGRVKVDFNHPLAGRTIEYEVEIKGEITDTLEKVKSVVRYFTGIKYEEFDTTINDKEAVITLQKHDLPKQVKQNIAETIMQWVDGITKVIFRDVFEAN